jgi:hypothetical protein
MKRKFYMLEAGESFMDLESDQLCVKISDDWAKVVDSTETLQMNADDTVGIVESN